MKPRISLFLALIGVSLGLGFWLRDRLHSKTRAQLIMLGDTLELPLENYGGHLYLQGQINGIPTKDLILDSGASDLFIGEPETRALRLQPQGETRIPGPSTTIPTVYVSHVSVQIGGLTLRDRRTVMIPQAEVTGLQQYFGRRVSGIIGYELFEQLVVEVDYQRQKVRLHRPESYRYQGNGQRLPLVIEGDRPLINASITPYGFPTLSGKLMIDLGSNAALSLTGGCGLSQRLIAAAPRTQRRNLATIEGAGEIVLGRVERLNLGSVLLKQPLTIFSTTDQGECNSIRGKIGAQILRQFKVILDYPHRQLILEPYSAQVRPSYEYDLSGLWLEATGPQLTTYRVGAISGGTPAAKAGIQVGDTILKVNNTVAADLTLVQLRQQLSQTGQTVNLGLQRNTTQISVRLKLEPLI